MSLALPYRSLLLPLLIASVSVGASSTASAATVNEKIVSYCKARIGLKVGSGECADLAVKAFEYAGARRTGPYGADADYVWGKLIGDIWIEGKLGGEGWSSGFGGVKPGDVIQYRNVKLQWTDSSGTHTATFPHHTAIVYQVGSNGAYTLLEQNVGSKRYVQKTVRVISMKSLKQGHVWFYRPQPK